MKTVSKQQLVRIGIDIGGTFTDFVVYDSSLNKLHSFKIPSTPQDPSSAVLLGLNEILNRLNLCAVGANYYVVHGSTIATNALLERKGAVTALVTTGGFKDVIQIGRQIRPSLYDFDFDIPSPLVPDQLRMEVNERVAPQGNVIQPIDISQIDELISVLHSLNVESIAVCLLFSFANPIHEQAITKRLRNEGNAPASSTAFFVSPSYEVLPEYREYERTSTTVVNAYVSPILERYLSRLESKLPVAVGAESPESVRLRVMQSNGGNISIQDARRYGVRCVLSGPAGGVTAAHFVAHNYIIHDDGNYSKPKKLSQEKIITFDMGGTSTDVALIEGEPTITTESTLAGFPIGIPVLDIHTIGAGGGSIARVDPGGALRVGPQSAGADPGPACYGYGAFPTVTDANLVLGRMVEEEFLGGRKKLEKARSVHVLAQLGSAMGLDPYEAALGVIEVANTHMERALRIISVERGHDPREFTLLSFGGAGGLHATDLARRLSIPYVIIPCMAATLSAFGMLVADVIKDYSQTIMLTGDAPSNKVIQALENLVQRGIPEVLSEGVLEDQITIKRFVDVRYRGQSYELTVPFTESIVQDFHQAHLQWYGYNRPGAAIEIVNVRVRLTGHLTSPSITAQPKKESSERDAFMQTRPVIVGPDDVWQDVRFYRGEKLSPGNQVSGPAIVVRDDTTIYLGSADSAVVDGYLNLIVKIGYI
jgi:N-methylhydantoinase A